MQTAGEQPRKWIFHVTKHISRTYWLECAFPAVIGDKHERGGLRYGAAAALSTLPAAQGAWVVTVIACSAGAWAEPQLGPGYLLGSTPSCHVCQPLWENTLLTSQHRLVSVQWSSQSRFRVYTSYLWISVPVHTAVRRALPKNHIFFCITSSR